MNGSQEPTWELAAQDDFSGGQAQLRWVPYPFFNEDNVHGAQDPTSPVPDQGIGVLANQNAGGFAALSYLEPLPLGDFRVETWLFSTVTTDERGPLNGIAFRIDPMENRYYRLASHFSADSSLTLAYVGEDERNYPVAVATWKGNDIPGGPPAKSGWHKVAIEVVDGEGEFYWDDQKLRGGPFAIDRITSGYVGVYATMAGGLGIAETKIADFKVFRPAA